MRKSDETNETIEESKETVEESKETMEQIAPEENKEHAVNLMTCHRSKGLEFPVVFIPGIQIDTFPNVKFVHSEAAIEAERRLLYKETDERDACHERKRAYAKRNAL